MQSDLNEVLGFTGEITGRYFYPFFVACFLGTMAIWLLDNDPAPTTIGKVTEPNGIVFKCGDR